ncbi:MAG: hypothetical protein K6E85_09325 [Lachnospiraceae bacterium]|nr:hypothetical protein [Lachnospiraceae bacterium]
MLKKFLRYCAYTLAFAALCLIFTGICISPTQKVQADDWDYWDDWDDWGYSGPSEDEKWSIKDNIVNFKTSDQVYYLDGQNSCTIEVTFDLKTLPESDYAKNVEYGVFVTNTPDDAWSYSNFSSTIFKGSDLKLKDNKYKLKFDWDGESLSNLFGSLVGDNEETKREYTAAVDEVYYTSSYKANPYNDPPAATYKFTAMKTVVKEWTIANNIHDVSFEKTTFSLGSEQKVKIRFRNRMHPSEDYSVTSDRFYAAIISDDGSILKVGEYSPYDFASDTDQDEQVNEITLSCRFPAKGIYYVVIANDYHTNAGNDASPSLDTVLGPYEIVVKKATDSEGNQVDTKNYIAPQYMFYSKNQGKDLKIYYSVDDLSSDYRLFVIKGNTTSYQKDTKKILDNADLMSKLDEFPLELGKVLEIPIKTKFTGMGLYTVVLYNATTGVLSAEESFYVVPDEYLIQRDMKGMTDTGRIGFSCDAKVYNFDLAKDDKVSFNVSFPIDFSKYVKEFQNKYGKGSKYYDYYSPSEYNTDDGASVWEGVDDDDWDDDNYGYYNYGNYYNDDDDDDDWDDDYSGSSGKSSGKDSDGAFGVESAFFSDDYTTLMTVRYTPAGSKESRVLFRRSITGMYKTHKIEFTAQDLIDAIYETKGSDIGYAGTVTVEFSNEEGPDIFDEDYDEWEDQWDESIYNEAIIKFTEKFSFTVNKSEKIKSAKAGAKKTERAYGERALFNVTDTLGGKIYAVIYKGKKKITTVTGSCSLNKDGTASGTIAWYLTDKNGDYPAAGKYKAKIYTVNEYPVMDANGKTTTKKVTSKKKSVSFTLVKPSASLSLKASVVGITGENYVYIENPLIGVDANVNIGSRFTVKIKNSSGTEVGSDSFISGKGSCTCWLDISGSNLKEGSYKAEITAKTLDGASKTTTASFSVKKMPKPSISDIQVSADSDNGSGSVSLKVSQPSTVTITIKSGSTTKQTVVSQYYSAGTIKASFSIGGYAPGTYSVSVTAKNSGGTAESSKSFEVKKKPVVVKKPTISNLNVRFQTGKDGDTYQGSFNYTGKNAKVVIDIMYNDTEEIVYTYEGTTTKDSGTFTYTWDGFKSNGFRARTGNYTMRVYLVNSAGKTEYLRRNFVIGEG